MEDENPCEPATWGSTGRRFEVCIRCCQPAHRSMLSLCLGPAIGPCPKGLMPMSTQSSRREFLGRGLQTVGVLSLASWPVTGWAADAASSGDLIDKAVAFL